MGKAKTATRKNHSGSKTNTSKKKSSTITRNENKFATITHKKRVLGKKINKNKSSTIKKYGGSKTDKAKKSKKIEWKPIPGWTKYEASTAGDIRNFWTEKILKKRICNGYYTA